MQVSFRKVVEEDRARLLAWRNSPAVAPYMYADHLITHAEHDRWFDGMAGDGARAFWVIELDGEPVGLVNLYAIDRAHRRSAWAYYLAEPSTRGKGVGAYVELCVLDHVFGPMALNKLWCEVLVANTSVWRLHQSFGFEIEATYRDHIFKGGQFHDVHGLAILADDWQRARETAAERLASKGWDMTRTPGLP